MQDKRTPASRSDSAFYYNSRDSYGSLGLVFFRSGTVSLSVLEGIDSSEATGPPEVRTRCSVVDKDSSYVIEVVGTDTGGPRVKLYALVREFCRCAITPLVSGGRRVYRLRVPSVVVGVENKSAENGQGDYERRVLVSSEGSLHISCSRGSTPKTDFLNRRSRSFFDSFSFRSKVECMVFLGRTTWTESEEGVEFTSGYTVLVPTESRGSSGTSFCGSQGGGRYWTLVNQFPTEVEESDCHFPSVRETQSFDRRPKKEVSVLSTPTLTSRSLPSSTGSY